MAVTRTRWLQFDRQRRQRRWLLDGMVVVLAIALAAADHAGWLLYEGDDLTRYHGRWFDVVAIVDGDTLDVSVRDGDSVTTRVRLWGINTPETAKDWLNKPADPLADEARQLLRQLCEHQRVRLDLEAHQSRDKFGRLLAYVQLRDGSVANEALVAAGLAQAEGRWDHRHIARYDLLERQAKHDGLGLWAAAPE